MSDVSQQTLRVTNQIAMRRAGRRKRVYHGGTLCSGCLEAPRAKGQHYCGPCHAARIRAYRAAALARKDAE